MVKYFLRPSAVLAAVLFVFPLAVSAQGYHQGRGATLTGVIASVSGGSFKFQNGRTIFLQNGTVINPTGTRLQPGMRVSVRGVPSGHGAINATAVNVLGHGGRMGRERR